MGSYGGVELDDLVLESSRLTLRRWQPDDADVCFRAMQDPGMRRFLRLPEPYTRADAEAFVAGPGDEGRRDGNGIGSALVERATGEVVGSAALRLDRSGPGQADIGYAVYPWARGRGYAAEATATYAEWAFAHGISRVELKCEVENLASARSAMNAGFRFEGVLRAGQPVAHGVADLALFARLPDDAGTAIAPSFPRLPAGGLTDGVITLRPQLGDDVDALVEEFRDELTRRWAFDDRPSDPAALGATARRSGLDWLVGNLARMAIVDVVSGEVAGGIQLRLVGPPGVAGIGYGLRASFRGRGYTTRALRLLSPWAMSEGGFVRLELGAKRDNVASQKAAASAGFAPDGVRGSRLRNPDGTYSDEVRYALIRPAG